MHTAYHRHSAAMFLSDYSLIACAAIELSNHMSNMPLGVYLAISPKLDEAQGGYPTAFCVKALLHAALL